MKKAAQKDGSGTTQPPALPHVKIYFMQKGLSEQEAVHFFRFLQARNWKTKTGTPIANWKAFANEWIWDYQQHPSPRQQPLSPT